MSFIEFAEYCFSVPYSRLPAQFLSLLSDDANRGEIIRLVSAAERTLRNVLLFTGVSSHRIVARVETCYIPNLGDPSALQTATRAFWRGGLRLRESSANTEWAPPKGRLAVQ